MPLPTSDFHTTVCLELRMLRNQQKQQHYPHEDQTSQLMHNCIAPPPAPFGPSTIIYNTIETTIKQTALTNVANNCSSNNNNSFNLNNNYPTNNATTQVTTTSTASQTNINNNYNNNNFHHSSSQHYQADLASVDSSDTYASCQTHPFLSQGDLTSDIIIGDQTCALDFDTNNLYVNPMEKDTTSFRSHVKRSASGDTALRNLCVSSLDDENDFHAFQPFTTNLTNEPRGSSSTSLNETPVPKHRKARFQSSVQQQQQSKPRARFEEIKRSQDSIDGNNGSGQQTTSKKNRRKLFESKSLASATKLINQHLFGLQGTTSKGRFI